MESSSILAQQSSHQICDESPVAGELNRSSFAEAFHPLYSDNSIEFTTRQHVACPVENSNNIQLILAEMGTNNDDDVSMDSS
ncbi:unnamed protein product [Adineta ricciae]|uniref:Uncharacterized protein n=1 Tax=Adineta ricciae TaxID=249248 RepID=A0A815G809_ADIRI|nr:unnamed protein product [Adineta ricciae]CAF1617163.1 unnamed protein product [Adineta ricciae]